MQDFSKNVYFGYVYDEGGIHRGKHYPAVVLEGADAVAKFVCNPETMGSDKMVTDALDIMMFSTYGVFINKVGEYANPHEASFLIEKVKEEQLRAFGNDEEEEYDEKEMEDV